MKKMSGTVIRKELLGEYKERIEKNNWKMKLVIIHVGEDQASDLYIHNKQKYTKEVGIESELLTFKENTTEEELIKTIEKLNADPAVTGIILQSPVPKTIDYEKCMQKILPEKDVDGCTDENLAKIRLHKEKILPCTVAGIIKILDYYHISVEGKDVTIIGRSNRVGRTLADALINQNATVTLCHSKTKDLKKHTKHADIIVSAVGKEGFITKDMVKKNFIGIDVGINFKDGKLTGDFSNEAVEKASYMTPVPGGVGPMTVAMIIENLIQLKEE